LTGSAANPPSHACLSTYASRALNEGDFTAYLGDASMVNVKVVEVKMKGKGASGIR